MKYLQISAIKVHTSDIISLDCSFLSRSININVEEDTKLLINFQLKKSYSKFKSISLNILQYYGFR